MKSRAELQAEYRKRHAAKFKRGLILINHLSSLENEVEKLYFDFLSFRENLKTLKLEEKI
jgi:hypothetical protein